MNKSPSQMSWAIILFGDKEDIQISPSLITFLITDFWFS
ncbi:Uncharacterised protein [Niallia circulans]|nr:Uncharacterised protein [Niallia circulans]